MSFKQKTIRSTWVVCFAVLCLLPVSLNAEIGIKGGLSVTNMRTFGPDKLPVFGPGAEEFKDKYYKDNAPNIGIFFNYEFDENLFIQPGFYYVVKGSTQEWTSKNVKYSQDIKMEYIEMPVFLKYSFAPDSVVSFYVLGGGYAAYRLSAKFLYDSESVDIKPLVKALDFGLTGGSGLDVKLNRSMKFCLEARYNHGLTNAHKAEVDEKGNIIDYKLKHRGFVFSVGFSLLAF